MIYPTDRFLRLLILPLAAAIALPVLALWPELAPFAASERELGLLLLLINGALVAALLLDALTIPRSSRFRAERSHETVFSVNFAHRVQLDILMKSGLRNAVRARVFDDSGDFMRVRRFPHDMELRAGKNSIEYRLQIRRRGRYALRRVYITGYSLLGFSRRVYRVPVETEIRVYPDLKAVSRYALLARKSHLGLLGIRRARRAGGDTDFERMREFQSDDEFRHIDWKMTAKQNRLIVRTYQLTQNQTIIFMIDCGRMMTAEFDGRSLLDYALNGALLLSHVALRQGDRAGMLAFGAGVHRYVKPAAGPVQTRRLIQAAYDLFPAHEESNFDSAFQFLNTVSRKRSLVCLITNVIDDMNAEQLLSYLGAISGRHLPFAVLLKQREIQGLLDRPPRSPADLFEQSAAADFLLWKENAVQRLKNRGVLCLEAFPDQLDSALINEYLKIKAKKLL